MYPLGLIRPKTPLNFCSANLTAALSILCIILAARPVMAISSRTLISPTGEATATAFGASVSSAGDVNGDGYEDVIVGAWGYSSNTGRAYVYYGGPGADTVADLTLTGEATGNYFGASVSSVGDLNGDGHADVIVGAYGYSTNTGRAYVYYGGPGADAVADLTLTGEATSNIFGASVSSAGDMNGDGYEDVIVGAWGYSSNTGRAYVYYGGPGADAVADLTLTGEATGNVFGASVSSAGDVNGDGYGDVIAGARGYSSNTGRAYVYYGGPGADALADLTLTGEATINVFGASVSSAGDVNGDGYEDVIVGAYGYSTNTGRAYVYYGGPGGDTVADLTLTGEATLNYFGASVSSAGDVNGDGYGDVIVGANSASSNKGRAYVTLIYPYELAMPNGGEQSVAGQPTTVRWRGHDVADVGLSTNGGATWTTIAAGVGGAQNNEVAVLAPATPTEFARVRVVYAGQAANHSTSVASAANFRIVLPVDPPSAAARLQRTLDGEASGDRFGYSTSAAGDVNGDGYGDVIVGAYRHNTDTGRAYVYFGGPGGDAVADLTLNGEAPGDNFGLSVSSAGDVNGDGYGDVIVGAYGYNIIRGRAYVYYGGPGADAVADLTLTGEAAGSAFGFSVSAAGDVNGDGFGDVLVGAWGYLTSTGRAYVYHGGPGADATADLTLTGEATNSYFGISVSGAGDVNADGYGDLVVGAQGYGGSKGRAYVYYGGPGVDATADLTLTGEAANNYFGTSVSSAGDVNGDGFGDVIAGASEYGGSQGRAYVYYGGRGADTVADLTLTGEAAGNSFGTTVSSAGDVNGDAYGDVIVGAFFYSGFKGRAYVYYGGPVADATADLTLTGEAAGDDFGASVSAAGDVNGDGLGDVIVGAYGYGGSTGRTHLYDFNRYQLLSPTGGATWNVGSTKTISWLGAEPADLWLSVDGGRTYDMLRSGIGGANYNSLPIQVPHSPTKFARLRVAPSDPKLRGLDESDSLFTIQTSVALLALLAAPAPNGARGIVISWQTDPGPEDLSGYRLEKATGSGAGWQPLVALTRETSVTDPQGGPGAKYRLFAVNGFGEELWLGEAGIRPLAGLAAWPLPYRGGNLTISFATFGGLGGGMGSAEVSVFDVSGRFVKRIARGSYGAGYQVANWDGKDERGRRVSSGVYFLKARSAGEERTFKLAVAR